MSHSKIELGELKSADLREAWGHEAYDFTNWLAEEEGLTFLSKALGMELEPVGTEHPVGPFRADLVCRDIGTKMLVLIENQLEQTDHLHLGQLLTYASGLGATTLVWVAKHFIEEHRSALDWLNSITNEKFNFFGLEVELWRINDTSPPAPKINIVSKPNNWSRSIKRVSEDTEMQQVQRRYWGEFNQVLIKSQGPVSDQSRNRDHLPPASPWVGYSTGKHGVYICTITSTRYKTVRVELCFESPLDEEERLEGFNRLHEQKNKIEKEIGEELVWRDKTSVKRIACVRVADPMDESDWPKQHEWLAEKLNRMHVVFADRVKTR